MEKPIKIIFDSDIGGDCDDAGALCLLHRLCDKGEAELLATTHCFDSPYLAGCMDAINTFNNRRVPVGINYGAFQYGRGTYAGDLCERFPNDYPAEAYGKTIPDTLTVLRKVLAEQEDNSVTLVVTGALLSMEKLYNSPPDEISSLSGKELVSKKIVRTVIMGGRFFETWPMPIFMGGDRFDKPMLAEGNIEVSGRTACDTVCMEWPGEIVYASYELGAYINTMVGYPSRAPKGDPVAEAYYIHNKGRGRYSWDLTAVLDAVRPGVYWNYHKRGRVIIGEDFVTRWQEDKNANHTYLMPKVDYDEVRQVIDDIIDGK